MPASAKERLRRRLQDKQKEEDSRLGPCKDVKACTDVQAAVYVSELSDMDLRFSLRVECDKLWN